MQDPWRQLSLVPGTVTGSGALCWRPTGSTTASTFKILGDLNNNVLSFSTTQGEAMRIDGSTGFNSVLIGSTDATVYKLHVGGSVYCTSMFVNGGLATGQINCTGIANSGSKIFDIVHPLRPLK